MSAFYDEMLIVATELLTEFGAPVTINVLTGNAYDPVTLTNDETFTDSIGNGVTVPISAKEMQNSLVMAGDMKLIIENIALAPTVGSTVTNNGIKYRVEMVEPLSPAGTNLIYTCMLRK